jgi:hypothetical protein
VSGVYIFLFEVKRLEPAKYQIIKAGTKEFTGTENYHGIFRCGCSAGRLDGDPLKIRT